MNRTTPCLVLVVLTLGLAAAPVQGAVTINIINADLPGVGFNDPTVVAPVGGNPGTTVGAQRLNVFTQAASIWGAALDSSVPIKVKATWEALTCDATHAILGSAGAEEIFRDFPLAPFPATWYHPALANRLSQVDNDTDPTTGHDLRARFNINLGNAGCLTGSFFYYGFDHNEGTNVDLLAVVLHEMGHGLGFQTFTDGGTGAYTSGFPSAFDHFLRDDATGLLWSDPTETDPQRVASAITGVGLTWTGANADAYGTAHMADAPQLVVTGSGAANGNYYVGTASFGAAPSSPGVTATMLLADDGAAPTSDACTALANAAAMSGKVCVVDRGTCAFTVKAGFCQAAGAVGMILVDNVAIAVPPPLGLGGTDPTITIPVVSVVQTDGTLIKANLGASSVGNLSTTNTRKAGMNAAGRMLMYAPNPREGGSSVSHWEKSAFPNLLMEPSINADLDGTLDSTLELMRDTGWFATLPVELMRFEIE